VCSRRLAILAVLATSLVAETKVGKLEAPLQAMCDALRTRGKAGLDAEAATRGIDLRSGRVSVRVTAATDEAIPNLTKVVIRTGARITAAEGSSVFADILVARLPHLAANTLVVGVYLDRPQQRPQAK